MAKRVKGCYNLECERYRKEYKYKDTDNFCTICGSRLIYVCSASRCFKKVTDTENGNTLCVDCKKKHDEQKAKAQQNIAKAKDAVIAGGKAAPAVIGFAKNKHVKKVAKAGVKVAKKIIKL